MTDGGAAKLAFMLLAGPALVAGGLYWRHCTRRIRRRARATTGTVVGSDVRRVEGGWTPTIRYRYAVGGQAYQNTQVFPPPGRTSGTGRWARRIARRYPAGSRATVHYLPDAPDTAYLIDRTEWFWLIPVALGAALLALALNRAGVVGV